jgi:hypothetical protein
VSGRKQRTLYVLLFGVAVLGLLVHALLFYRYTVDDAFISFRYARNLVDGRGLVYNPGERVEGYTNFLWTIGHALCIRAGCPPEIVAKGIGLFAAVGTLILTALLAHAWGHARSPLGAISLILWAASGAVAVSAMTGLETHLFAFMVVAGITLYSRPVRSARHLAGSLVSLGLSALLRPDGLLFLFLTLLHYYATERRHRALWPLGLALLLVLPHPLWRLSYYGTLVPNTFGAKTGGGLLQTQKGFEYLKGFINEYGKPALYLFAAIAFVRFPLGRQRGYALTAIGIYLAYLVYVGGDWIPHYRFLIPIMPLLYLAVQDGILMLHDAIPPWRGRARHWPTVVLWSFLAVIVYDIANQTKYLRLHTEMWANGYRHAHNYVGNWLERNADADDTVALMDIGLVGYLSGVKIIDITGLTDPHIAAAPGGWLKKNYSLDYLFSRQPEFFVLVSSTDYPTEGFATSFPIDRAIFCDPRLIDRYTFVFSRDAYLTRVPHESGYHLLVFAKNVTPGTRKNPTRGQAVPS